MPMSIGVRLILLMGVLASTLGRLVEPETGTRTVVNVTGRKAHVYLPRCGVAQKPGIFVLHGSGNVAADMFEIGFEREADLHGFMVVYPEMVVERSMNWGYDADLPFLSALVARLQQEDYGLDQSRAFICGHSAGGTMALYVQNQIDDFDAAGAVEAAVGHLDKWNMSRKGHRSIVVWNHADPVLEEYAPAGGEPAYYNLTVSTLRRHGSQTPSSTKPLPTSQSVVSAELRIFDEDAAPELVMLSWRSNPGTHAWPCLPTFSFGAAQQLVRFFLREVTL